MGSWWEEVTERHAQDKNYLEREGGEEEKGGIID